MMELQLVLDFACCSCNHTLSVSLKCSGKGLAAGGRSVAAVKVPCPTCNGMNELYFEPKYEEFRPRTIWSLSNAFTSAFKELEPIPQFKVTAKLGEFLEDRFSQSF